MNLLSNTKLKKNHTESSRNHRNIISNEIPFWQKKPAVTRIRTWVTTVTTWGPNHENITAKSSYNLPPSSKRLYLMNLLSNTKLKKNHTESSRNHRYIISNEIPFWQKKKTCVNQDSNLGYHRSQRGVLTTRILRLSHLTICHHLRNDYILMNLLSNTKLKKNHTESSRNHRYIISNEIPFWQKKKNLR